MQGLWDEAVQFIEANESRIRVETQIIQGEEFTVWRWLQVSVIIIYGKCPKILYTKVSHKMAYANSEDTDQTAPEGAV